MTIIQAAAVVAAIVLFLKEKLIPGIWDKLGDIGKFAITILAAAGVTVYKYMTEGLPFNIETIWFFIQVAIAATSGYLALKAAAPNISRSVRNGK